MALPQVTALTPPNDAPRLPGTWKLAGGRAITLEPRESGVLRVAHGQLWATFDDGPHGASPQDSGDRVIGVGERLRVAKGERVVLEPIDRAAPAYFSWDPQAAAIVRRTPARARIVQPLADLRLALVFGGGAVARLAAGVAALGWELAAGRPRESVEERACRRHGAPV